MPGLEPPEPAAPHPEHECSGCGLRGLAEPLCYWCRTGTPREAKPCTSCQRHLVYFGNELCEWCRRPKAAAQARPEAVEAVEQRTREQLFEEERERVRRKKYKRTRSPKK